MTVCDATAAWLRAPTTDLPCTRTPCPNAGDRNRVCLAGFWGYRHAVSTSISNPNQCGVGLTTAVPSATPPKATVAVTTDEEVRPHWTTHSVELAKWIAVPKEPAVTAADALKAMKEGLPTIAYFLAHVVYEQDSPRIKLAKGDAPAIDANAIQDAELRLCPSRPLVFLNACASAGLEPDRMLGLIDRFFMHGAGAAVGTEITVFADLATKFAEAFVERFACGVSLGEAMRAARVAVLSLRNPLGLAYTGYGLHDVRLAVNATA